MSSYKQAGRVLQVLATYFNLEEGHAEDNSPDRVRSVVAKDMTGD